VTEKRDREPNRPAVALRLLAVAQIMERLQLSRPAAYRLMKRLPGCVYIGKAIRVHEKALESFLENGGDSVRESATTSSIFTERLRNGAAMSAECKADVKSSNRTKHWLSKLRSSSTTDTSRRTPGSKEHD